jgi:hypothetical protein
VAQTITRAKQIQSKSRRHVVRRVRPNWYKVTSSETGYVYDVNLGLNGGTCTCSWGKSRPGADHRSACSHVIAAMEYRAEQQGRRISVWSSHYEAHRQHRPVLAIGDGLFITSRVH